MKLRAVLIAAGLALVAAVLVRYVPRGGVGFAGSIPSPAGGTDVAGKRPAPITSHRDRRNPVVPAPDSVSVAPASSNWLERFLSGSEDAAHLPRTTIDRWVAAGHTNAEELLAAVQAGGGAEFMRLALTNFPNDPRVLLAASSLDDGPDARRERLNRFKASAPDNALADYLSAGDHLRNGRAAEAVADLEAAGGKAQFQDYMIDAVQNAEDLYLDSGKSPAEAKALAASSALLPQLAQFKGLAQELAVLQKQYLGAGDAGSAGQLGRLGYQLGQQLVSGGGSGTLVGQLVGAAVERIVLSPLDPNQHYDFLPGTVAEQLADLSTRREAVRQVSEGVGQWMSRATDSEIITYFDRRKLYGEFSAMEWLRQRQSAVPGP